MPGLAGAAQAAFLLHSPLAQQRLGTMGTLPCLNHSCPLGKLRFTSLGSKKLGAAAGTWLLGKVKGGGN